MALKNCLQILSPHFVSCSVRPVLSLCELALLRYLKHLSLQTRVTRFDEITPFWQKIKSLWPLLDILFSIWLTFDPTLVNFIFLKMGQPRPLFCLFSVLFKQTLPQFLQQINVKKCHVHPVYGTGIRTHDLWIVSLLP